MREFIKTINKYAILLIVSSLFGMPWFYLRYLIFDDYRPDSIINFIPTFVDYLIRLIVIVLLIIDFKKNNLKNIVVTTIATLFFPLLGIVMFSILLIEKRRDKANA
jgi:hypothetical protein